MMILMLVHHHHHQHHHGAYHPHLLRHRPYLFCSVRFKCPVRPDLRCRRCADTIIIMPTGDAEDAS